MLNNSYWNVVHHFKNFECYLIEPFFRENRLNSYISAVSWGCRKCRVFWQVYIPFFNCKSSKRWDLRSIIIDLFLFARSFHASCGAMHKRIVKSKVFNDWSRLSKFFLKFIWSSNWVWLSLWSLSLKLIVLITQ